MPKVSVNILTKNRAELIQRCLASVRAQRGVDFEVVVVDDGSTDETQAVLKNFHLRPPEADYGGQAKSDNLKIIRHETSRGITVSRQEALEASGGEYIAVLDDDDEWIDVDKLKKQAEFLDNNPEYVLVGGGIESVSSNIEYRISKQGTNEVLETREVKFRVGADADIRRTMLLRNNFFTSTVMFRKEAAVKAGGFLKDEIDLAEDYDLWLRLGKLGKMRNFREVFTRYRQPRYNTDKFRLFLRKQLRLIKRHREEYGYYWIAKMVLGLRLLF